MKHFFRLATIAMITVKMSFTHYHSSSSQRIIFFHQNHATYSSKLSLRKWSSTDKDYRRKFVTKLYVICSMLRAKTLASGSKCIKFFFIFTTICLVWLVCASTPTKIEHKKIFCGPSKVLINVSWCINICLKYFMTLTKILQSPLLHT